MPLAYRIAPFYGPFRSRGPFFIPHASLPTWDALYGYGHIFFHLRWALKIHSIPIGIFIAIAIKN